MRFEELHELAAPYAIGALDPSESAEFEHHIGDCARCRREVADLSGVVEELAQADAVAPPSELRSRVLDEIARTPQSASPPDTAAETVLDLTRARTRRADRRSGSLVLAAAAAFVFLIGGAAALLTLTDRDDAYDSVVAAADARTLQLDGEVGTVTVVYSADLDRVGVLSTDLPDPGEGKTYELWLVVDGGVAPAGLFTPADGEVRDVLSVEDVETQGFGISIEPVGGSDQPTGEILFFDTF